MRLYCSVRRADGDWGPLGYRLEEVGTGTARRPVKQFRTTPTLQAPIFHPVACEILPNTPNGPKRGPVHRRRVGRARGSFVRPIFRRRVSFRTSNSEILTTRYHYLFVRAFLTRDPEH